MASLFVVGGEPIGATIPGDGSAECASNHAGAADANECCGYIFRHTPGVETAHALKSTAISGDFPAAFPFSDLPLGDFAVRPILHGIKSVLKRAEIERIRRNREREPGFGGLCARRHAFSKPRMDDLCSKASAKTPIRPLAAGREVDSGQERGRTVASAHERKRTRSIALQPDRSIGRNAKKDNTDRKSEHSGR